VVDVPGVELAESVAFPAVLLAPVVGQSQCPEKTRSGANQTTMRFSNSSYDTTVSRKRWDALL
jgi:hypothetical protein